MADRYISGHVLLMRFRVFLLAHVSVIVSRVIADGCGGSSRLIDIRCSALQIKEIGLRFFYFRLSRLYVAVSQHKQLVNRHIHTPATPTNKHRERGRERERWIDVYLLGYVGNYNQYFW